MRKNDEDWVKKCRKFRVEGRRPVGRPKRTWLESVEADMAELKIDKEDIHDRKFQKDTTYTRLECYRHLYTLYLHNPAPRDGGPDSVFWASVLTLPATWLALPHKSGGRRFKSWVDTTHK